MRKAILIMSFLFSGIYLLAPNKNKPTGEEIILKDSHLVKKDDTQASEPTAPTIAPKHSIAYSTAQGITKTTTEHIPKSAKNLSSFYRIQSKVLLSIEDKQMLIDLTQNQKLIKTSFQLLQDSQLIADNIEIFDLSAYKNISSLYKEIPALKIQFIRFQAIDLIKSSLASNSESNNDLIWTKAEDLFAAPLPEKSDSMTERQRLEDPYLLQLGDRIEIYRALHNRDQQRALLILDRISNSNSGQALVSNLENQGLDI